MKMEGTIKRTNVPAIRHARSSKYTEVVNALKTTSAEEAVIISLEGEKNPRGAAQRVVNAVRKYADGVITGKIKSRFSESKGQLFLWASPEEK